jgi:fucose 4-O-acetylase-like acetyltransferase
MSLRQAQGTTFDYAAYRPCGFAQDEISINHGDKMNKGRVAYIDIARGLGIMLVVLGHTLAEANYHVQNLNVLFLGQLIYSFHMPLFFFLSGMFFKPDMRFPDLLKRRFDSLLKPYLFTLFLIYFVSVFYDKNLGLSTAAVRIVKALYGNSYYLELYWSQIWFLPALFAINLFAFGFYAIFKRLPVWTMLIGLLLTLGVGILTINWFMPFKLALFGYNLELSGLPFSLDIVLVCGFFFLLGREVYERVPLEVFSPFWVLIASAAVTLALNWQFPATLGLNFRVYESPLFNTLEALAGIVFIISLSQWIEKWGGWLSRLLQYYGKISLIVLIFHSPVQFHLGRKLASVLDGSIYGYLIAFPFALLIPVFVYIVFIQPNPILLWLFGLTWRPAPKPAE